HASERVLDADKQDGAHDDWETSASQITSGERRSITTGEALYNAPRVGGGVPAILAAQLGKRYGHTDALKEVDLRVEAGEFFGLFGPNGAGQKLMLAAAFLHDPALVFLDEPFINLDPIYQRKLKDFLLGYVAHGGTVLMASHLLDIAEKLCDRVAVIRSGSIIATGTLNEIRGRDTDLESAFLRLVGA